MELAPYEFHAPWLNGRPIDAPGKVDMINWYAQTDGYFPEASRHGANGILKFFRAQGRVLYNDEFHSEGTAAFNCHSTTGRVKRVIRAIDMMNQYKAACEDGADLSESLIVDFETVWYSFEGTLIPRHSMHNLRHVKDEQNNRSPEDCPLKAFWKGQEAERSRYASQSHITDALLQDHPSATDDPTALPALQYYHGHKSDVPLYFPSIREPQPLARALDPTTAAFVPCNGSTLATLPAQERHILSQTGPNYSSGAPAAPQTVLIGAESTFRGHREYSSGQRGDERWNEDESFIPTFCDPEQPSSQPHLSEPGPVSPEPEAAEPIRESNSTPERRTDNYDSGYSTLVQPPFIALFGATIENDSGNETNEGVSTVKIWSAQSAQSSQSWGRDNNHGTYSMLKMYEMLVDDVDLEVEKIDSIFAWLDGQN